MVATGAGQPKRVRRAVVAAPAPAAPAVHPVPARSSEEAHRVRPVGVAVLAVFGFMGALFTVVGAVALLVFLAAGAALMEEFVPVPAGVQSAIALVGSLVAVFLFAWALFTFVVALGTWRGRAWAWIINVVVIVIFLPLNILQAVASATMVEDGGAPVFFYTAFVLGLNLFILWYLYEPGVQRFFGRHVRRAFWHRSPAPAT